MCIINFTNNLDIKPGNYSQLVIAEDGNIDVDWIPNTSS